LKSLCDKKCRKRARELKEEKRRKLHLPPPHTEGRIMKPPILSFLKEVFYL
jgi:hypothetical protein